MRILSRYADILFNLIFIIVDIFFYCHILTASNISHGMIHENFLKSREVRHSMNCETSRIFLCMRSNVPISQAVPEVVMSQFLSESLGNVLLLLLWQRFILFLIQLLQPLLLPVRCLLLQSLWITHRQFHILCYVLLNRNNNITVLCTLCRTVCSQYVCVHMHFLPSVSLWDFSWAFRAAEEIDKWTT